MSATPTLITSSEKQGKALSQCIERLSYVSDVIRREKNNKGKSEKQNKTKRKKTKEKLFNRLAGYMCDVKN